MVSQQELTESFSPRNHDQGCALKRVVLKKKIEKILKLTEITKKKRVVYNRKTIGKSHQLRRSLESSMWEMVKI